MAQESTGRWDTPIAVVELAPPVQVRAVRSGRQTTGPASPHDDGRPMTRCSVGDLGEFTSRRTDVRRYITGTALATARERRQRAVRGDDSARSGGLLLGRDGLSGSTEVDVNVDPAAGRRHVSAEEHEPDDGDEGDQGDHGHDGGGGPGAGFCHGCR